MKNSIATILCLVLLTHITPTASAQTKGNWDTLKAFVNHSVAVRTKSGETHFGLLTIADEAGIEIRIAGDDDFTGQEIALKRDEVQKLWRARLRFGEKNIAKAAWIGAGAGLGAVAVTAAVLSARNSDDPPVGLGMYPIYGAGAGAVAGAFWKKKHKKQNLIYSA